MSLWSLKSFFCTAHMFTRFRRHWVETCHCAEFSFTWPKSFKLKHLKLFCFHWMFLFPSSNHWSRDLLITVELYYLFWSLKSTMATVTSAAAGTNTGSAWRTEQHSAVTDQGTVRVFHWKGTTDCWWPIHCASTCTDLWNCLSHCRWTWHPHWLEFEDSEDQWSFVYHSVNYWLWGQTASNWSVLQTSPWLAWLLHWCSW